MNLLELDKKMVLRVSAPNVRHALMGQALFFLALGSIFSLKLVRYGYFIFLAATLLAVVQINGSFSRWHAKVTSSYGQEVLGVVSALLLMLFLGIQSPQIPFKPYLLALGLIFMLPALRDALKNVRKV